MEGRTIYITEFDMKRLRALIEDAKRLDRRGNEYLESLEAELDRGVLVAPTGVPPDIVTMNSRVRLVDLDTNEEMVYTRWCSPVTPIWPNPRFRSWPPSARQCWAIAWAIRSSGKCRMEPDGCG
jgi:hypothetical protein